MRTDRTQRWRDGRDSWRPASEGGFDPDRYDVIDVDHATAADFVRRHHYSASWPSTTYRFALVDHGADAGGEVVGIMTLGTPMSQRVLTNPFPTLVPNEESLDWSRLVLHDSVPANGESWFSARALRLAAERGVRGVVTFADPVARWRSTPAGRVQVKPGHVGIIYQALGMDYLGRGTKRNLIVLPDASVLTARAISKVTGGERGAAGVVRRLVTLGAPSPVGRGLEPADWLKAALFRIGAYRQRHPGNHRYALRIGSRAVRTRTLIAMPSRKYPKPELTLPLFGEG